MKISPIELAMEIAKLKVDIKATEEGRNATDNDYYREFQKIFDRFLAIMLETESKDKR